ncbi:hypothetical protein FEK33_18720 [Nocardia asteroides NBRC 15531]|uniref:Uncharacterized protein n=1 Tax=Nocardia asteroides NBRC 15531 TaxID=1110697 RepID=U5E874_NOCAS|nr:hypothetical protein [Nocardia asteroides]TLF65360.1 hypothetical protein FEK33_18720 [Nocardia asteroides NBRC 15531]UGT47890.1 hypothetical protein LT345_25910 [Nocardia asteroides]SFM58616.1 hypothetical protein SAMN05444423_103480 [Nocardia asteroides]VEG33178.1 Uncharacterised protein [Nocardia asteroides]GAD82643.1 hypothetical protein NCAST_11_01410 [Nocardia asteroides NBRC 15531]
MSSAIGLIDRYQNYRVRRWLVQEQRTAGMLTGWRTRQRRRLLVVGVVIALSGLALTQSLTMPPLAYLIFAGAIAPEAAAYRTAYAGGLMMLAALLAGGCAPAMILAWTRPDPDPEA